VAAATEEQRRATKAAQERGEVAKRGEQDRVRDNVGASDIMPPARLEARGCVLAGSPPPSGEGLRPLYGLPRPGAGLRRKRS
jgi:hypothetical protein